MKSPTVPLQGVLLALAATTLFALVSPYIKLLSPLSGTDIFAWRIIWTTPFVLVLIAMRKRFGAFRALLGEFFSEPRRALELAACAGMMGVQQWLFLWAPLHGRMLEVSLGYFVLPIVMVLVGWLVDRHPVAPLQWLAVAFAAAGVAHEFISHSGISWPLLVVALGFPPYFLLRRKVKHDSLTVLAAEILILLPVALVAVFQGDTFHIVIDRIDLLTIRLPILGMLTALSFMIYLKASRMLPMALFGLLGYVEPTLLVAIATFIFREDLAPGEVWTYVPIALSVAVTALYVMLVTPRGS